MRIIDLGLAHDTPALPATPSRQGQRPRLSQLAVSDLRQDLIAVSVHLAELLASEPLGSVVASIILESRGEPSLDELRRKLIAQRQGAVEQVMSDAMSRGELRDNVRADAVANDLAAQITFQSLAVRESMDRWAAPGSRTWSIAYSGFIVITREP